MLPSTQTANRSCLVLQFRPRASHRVAQLSRTLSANLRLCEIATTSGKPTDYQPGVSEQINTATPLPIPRQPSRLRWERTFLGYPKDVVTSGRSCYLFGKGKAYFVGLLFASVDREFFEWNKHSCGSMQIARFNALVASRCVMQRHTTKVSN